MATPRGRVAQRRGGARWKLLVALAAMVVLVSAATAWNAVEYCYLAIYNCPSGGCGDIPCQDATDGLVAVLAVGGVILTVAVVWERARVRGRPEQQGQ